MSFIEEQHLFEVMTLRKYCMFFNHVARSGVAATTLKVIVPSVNVSNFLLALIKRQALIMWQVIYGMGFCP